MKKKSKQNNPEQKTKSQDVEASKEFDPVKEVKKMNAKRAQPIRSK